MGNMTASRQVGRVSPVYCAQRLNRSVRVVWAGSNMELTQWSKGGSSGSVEIAEALTEVVKVLKFLRRDMVMGFEEIVNALNKEYMAEDLLEADSELELELTPDELTELAEESKEGEFKEGELYQEWLVETGRVRKSGEEVEEKVEEKWDEENAGKGKEGEVVVE